MTLYTNNRQKSTKTPYYSNYKCTSLNISADFGSYPNLTKIGDYAFFNCTSITGRCYIGNKVGYIGDHAFAYCTGLNEGIWIDTEKGTDTEVKNCVFYGCSNAIWISTNTNVTYAMFAYCTNVIETGVSSKSINSYGFYYVGSTSSRTGFFRLNYCPEIMGNNAFECLRTGNLQIGTTVYTSVADFEAAVRLSGGSGIHPEPFNITLE